MCGSCAGHVRAYLVCRFVYHFLESVHVREMSFAFLMTLEPAAPLPPTSKTMKMMTVLCFPFDFGASHPRPTHFQNHENDGSPMYLL